MTEDVNISLRDIDLKKKSTTSVVFFFLCFVCGGGEGIVFFV